MIEDGIYAGIEACLNGFHADEMLSRVCCLSYKNEVGYLSVSVL